jgi:hypothetical protein
MKKKTLIALSSLFAATFLAAASIGSFSPEPWLVEGAGTAAKSCLSITFGEGTTADGGTALTSASYSATGFDAYNLSLTTVTKAYSAGAGNPGRIGTGSAVGELTFSFSSCVVTSIRLYAYQYGSDGVATVSLKTSALSSADTASISTATAPSLEALNGDGIYLFDGLDNGTGAGSTSLTIKSDGANRFYLAKILLTVNGSSSAASSALTSSPTTSSSSSSAVSSPAGAAEYYRVVPSQSSSSTAPIYNVSYASGSYIGTQITTISKTQDCLTYEDVCAYYQAFRQAPPNYQTSKTSALSYGTNGRVISTYKKGSYTGSNDYSVKLGTFRNSTGNYLELDIDLDGTYNDGSTITRGTGRVVVVVDGITEYGDASPVCFYTADHYSSLKEYYNRYQGWGSSFTSYDTHAFATTVTYTVA